MLRENLAIRVAIDGRLVLGLHGAPIDPVIEEWHLIPTHSRKGRGNGWGTRTVFGCRIYSDAKPQAGEEVRLENDSSAYLDLTCCIG